MSIVAWVAIAIIVTSNGPSIIAAGKPFASKEACEKANADMLAVVKAKPEFERVVAIGTGCAEVEVTKNGEAVAPEKQKGPTQQDLEKEFPDATHGSHWRSANGNRM